MMNKKQNIQIAVIIIAFGASGFVLYNGFFKGSGSTSAQSIASMSIPGEPGSGPDAVVTAGAPASAGSQTILPAGNQLDFSVLKSQNLVPQDISYPQLNPNGDIGVSEDNLIIPTPTTNQ
jgi:hypothetical protein